MQTRGSWLFARHYYDEEAFERDLTTLREFHMAHGYFDARVNRGLFKERERGGNRIVSPVVQIDE
jgi:outer membrane protein assembly factor BamA